MDEQDTPITHTNTHTDTRTHRHRIWNGGVNREREGKEGSKGEHIGTADTKDHLRGCMKT